jgi:predicted RNA-binding Zn-ribbon protein involved in translation (DUF1610 family)
MARDVSITRRILKELTWQSYLAQGEQSSSRRRRALQTKCPSCGRQIDVRTNKKYFSCTGCDARGSIVDFHMWRHDVTRIEAIRHLAGRAGLADDPGMPPRVLGGHVYTDEAGKPLTRVVRLEDGSAPMYRRTVRGQWEPGIEHTRRVPYRLTGLAGASEVYVCENEAEADALAGVGLTATCFSGGLSGWRGEFDGHFRGKDVFVVHGDDAGYQKGVVAAALAEVTRTVRTVKHANLAVGDEGLVGWVEESRTEMGMSDEAIARELSGAAWRVNEWAATEPEQLMSTAEVIARGDISTKWLIPGLIPEKSVVLLSGAPGAMKTFLALLMAACVADGRPFLGRTPAVSKVNFIAGEGDPSTMNRYFKLLGVNAKSAIRHWMALDGQAPPKFPRDDYLDMARHKPLVIFDSLIRFMPDGADENSAVEMRHVTEFMQRLKACGATVLMLHHAGKAETSNFRGSSELAAGVDVSYTLRKPKDGRLDLECCKSRFGPLFRLSIEVGSEGDRLEFKDVTEASREKQREEAADVARELARIIGANEGLSKKDIVEAAAGLEISKARVGKALKEHEGTMWRKVRGEKNSYAYSLIQEDLVTVPRNGGSPVGDHPDPMDIW